jgi:hypothetical protein
VKHEENEACSNFLKLSRPSAVTSFGWRDNEFAWLMTETEWLGTMTGTGNNGCEWVNDGMPVSNLSEWSVCANGVATMGWLWLVTVVVTGMITKYFSAFYHHSHHTHSHHTAVIYRRDPPWSLTITLSIFFCGIQKNSLFICAAVRDFLPLSVFRDSSSHKIYVGVGVGIDSRGPKVPACLQNPARFDQVLSCCKMDASGRDPKSHNTQIARLLVGPGRWRVFRNSIVLVWSCTTVFLRRNE